MCSYSPRAQTTFLRCNGWVSSARDTAWAARQTVLTPPHENLASWEVKEQPPPREETSSTAAGAQLLLHSRCAGSRGTGSAGPCTKAQLHSAGALLLQRSCCAQQASSVSEFQQPRSFTSLCKSLLSLDWQNTYLTQKPAQISTNPAWHTDGISHFLFQPYNQKVRITVNGIFSILCFKRSNYFIIQCMYTQISNNYSEYYLHNRAS